MSSILEVSVDSEDFAPGRTLDAGVDATVTLEEAIPTADRAMPYFWTSGENVDEFEASLEDDPSVENVRRHLTLSTSALYHAQWTEAARSLLTSIAEEGEPSSTAPGRPAAGSSPCAFPTTRASRTSGQRSRYSFYKPLVR